MSVEKRRLGADDFFVSLRPIALLAAALSFFGDAALAGAYLITWLAPHSAWARPIGTLMLLMMMEFIIIHSSAFMGKVWTEGAGLARRTRSMFGFGLFYLLMVAGFAAGFGAWWPVGAFTLLMVNRWLSMVFDPEPSAETRRRVERGWAVATGLYLAGAFATTLLPVPRFGIDDAARLAADLPGSGLWISQPHRVIAFGFVYFGLTALVEARHRWHELRTSPALGAIAQTDRTRRDGQEGGASPS